jgi:hypothetical protein
MWAIAYQDCLRLPLVAHQHGKIALRQGPTVIWIVVIVAYIMTVGAFMALMMAASDADDWAGRD